MVKVEIMFSDRSNVVYDIHKKDLVLDYANRHKHNPSVISILITISPYKDNTPIEYLDKPNLNMNMPCGLTGKTMDKSWKKCKVKGCWNCKHANVEKEDNCEKALKKRRVY